MPECDFIMTDDDQKDLVEHILAQGVKFVPCLRYRAKVYSVLCETGAVLQAIDANDLIGPLLLLSKEFTSEPLVLSPSMWRRRCWFTVDIRYGGPYLDLLPCFSHKARVPPFLTSGSLGYYRSYYLDGGEQEVPAPDALKSVYRSIKGFIRRRCVKYVVGKVNRLYWVAPSVIEECCRGLTTNVPGLEQHARMGM